VGMRGHSWGDGMDVAAADHLEDQLRSAFPDGVIVRVTVLLHGDDPEVEPGQTAARAFFDWAGRLDGKQADPQTVLAFCVANGAAIDKLRTELPGFVAWVEFRPDNPPGATAPGGLSYRIERHRKRPRLPDEDSEELIPVMSRLGLGDLAILDTLITAGIANSRAKPKRGWLRSNIVSLFAALIALAALIIPIGREIYHNWTRPRATISDLKFSGTLDKANCATDVDANVSTSHIAADSSLWLVARDFLGLWYPAARVDLSMHDAEGFSISPDPVSGYVVILLSNSSDSSFVKYNSHPNSRGLYSLPPGYRLLDTWARQDRVDPGCSPGE
jgi:hypothetical protein